MGDIYGGGAAGGATRRSTQVQLQSNPLRVSTTAQCSPPCQ
jgi:hypothetical protein